MKPASPPMELIRAIPADELHRESAAMESKADRDLNEAYRGLIERIRMEQSDRAEFYHSAFAVIAARVAEVSGRAGRGGWRISRDRVRIGARRWSYRIFRGTHRGTD